MSFVTSSAYSGAEIGTRSAREQEYEVIARVTRQLAQAASRRQSDAAGFLEALFRNEQLWSTLASDVASPGNGLPERLRAQLLYLYRFTAEHSERIRKDAGSVEVLLDINKAVLRGLRGEVAP